MPALQVMVNRPFQQVPLEEAPWAVGVHLGAVSWISVVWHSAITQFDGNDGGRHGEFGRGTRNSTNARMRARMVCYVQAL